MTSSKFNKHTQQPSPVSDETDSDDESFERKPFATRRSFPMIQWLLVIATVAKVFTAKVVDFIRFSSRRVVRKKAFIMSILSGVAVLVAILHLLHSRDIFRGASFLTDKFEAVAIDYDNKVGLDKNLQISKQVISSRIDAPFQIGCAVPDTKQPRADAAFVVLARNSEVKEVVKSMESLERHFNRWYKYPWVFLNDEPFDEEFIETVRKHASGGAEFGEIPKKEWDFNESVDPIEFNESINSQGDRTVMYGNLESYHKMCRFYSGFFYKHPLVAKRKWYWRVEPDVEFYCDITYDPFIEMQKSGKKYGFTVVIGELYYTVPNLFRETKSFIKKNALTVGNAWNLFIQDSKFSKGAHQQDYDDMSARRDILKEMESNVMLQKFLDLGKKKDYHIDQLTEELRKKLFKSGRDKPKLYEDRIEREEYNLCHFWSNFEIARTDLFTSSIYEEYFKHLEESGGFYKERWGDAPVHSLAIGMLLDLKDIHYFRDIGYRHSNIAHCPDNAPVNQLKLDYTPLTREDKFWSKPDAPSKNGVGCRCRCPTDMRDIENSGASCMSNWGKLTSNNYKAFEEIDLDHWEVVIERMVSNYISTGGDIGGDSNVVEKLLT